ncbi:MAG: acyl-CoA thioesterase [Peptococcaceae bacterium]|jgi:acyl-CoA thioester hydrolase|nr:acyl-CoA thioesterase [Peptococcaceae bacterium]
MKTTETNQPYISKTDIQISYADTDMMGIIYHANYLKWFELGRTQFVEDAGYDYLDMEKAGFSAPVYQVEATYKKPVRYGDQVTVETWVEQNDGLKTVYGYHVVNGEGELCATGSSTHIIVRREDFKPVQFKKIFPEWFQKYETIKKRV